METEDSLPRVHKSPLLVSILSHMNPANNFPPYFPKIDPNIFFPSTPRSSELSLIFRCSDKNFYAFFSSPMRATFPPISSSLIPNSFLMKLCHPFYVPVDKIFVTKFKRWKQMYE